MDKEPKMDKEQRRQHALELKYAARWRKEAKGWKRTNPWQMHPIDCARASLEDAKKIRLGLS